MITRKENILVRPFQHRKFIEHRKKVTRALPRIDDICPPQRNHVYIKCKKLQSEAERHAQIERDNFILLKHLREIMTEKRVDNFWLQEHPRFLRRIKLFDNQSNKYFVEEENTETEQKKKLIRNHRCMACNSDELPKSKPIPEERVPWEPKVIREFINEKSNRAHSAKNNSYQSSQNTILKTENSTKTLNRPKPLLKLRSRTEPNINSFINNHKQNPERPLTVVMKFPRCVQVALNASLK